MKKIFILFLLNLCYVFVFANEAKHGFFSGLTIDNINSSDASCIADDGMATVIAAGGVQPLTYAWENATNEGVIIATENPATGLATGTYNVTVSDATGCTTVGSIDIGAPPSPLFLGSDVVQPTCGNADGAIILLIEDSLQPLTYDWENAMNPGTTVSTENPAIGLTAGIYNATITGNNGCTTTVSISLAEQDGIEIMDLLTSPSTCGQANGGALVTLNGGTMPYTYNWENNNEPGVSVSISEVAGDLAEGIYNVAVTDANGCMVFGTVTVTGTPPLTFQTTSIDPTCLGAADGSAGVDADGGSFYYTYLWSNGSTEQVALELPVGIHTVTVTDTDGCVGTTEVELNAPDDISFTATSTSACSGAMNGTVSVQNVVGGMSPYSYSADGVSYFMDSVLTNLPEGLYDIHVQDVNGCVGIVQTQINASEAASFETTSTNSTCSGIADGTITVLDVSGGSAPYMYSLDGINYSEDSIFSDLTEGLYDVLVQDANGCVTLVNQSVENTIELFLDYGEDVEIDFGESLSLFPTSNFSLDTTLYTWTWAQDTTLIFNSFPYNPSVQPVTTTTYNVSVSDANGCSVSDAITVRVDIDLDLFIPNAFSPNFDGNNDIFIIFGGISVARITRMEVFNRSGAKVHEAFDFSPGNAEFGWDGMLNNNPAAQGVYVYYVEVEFVNGIIDTYRGDVTLVR